MESNIQNIQNNNNFLALTPVVSTGNATRTETFYYEGKEVAFQFGNGDVMINATQMAKAFGKRTNDFVRLSQTEDFIYALSTRYGISRNGIVNVVQGGISQGTWMHQKLALKFAAWLSPEFELWVYDRIEEVMRHGFTATDNVLEKMIANPDLLIGLATELKRERQEKARLELVTEQQTIELQKQAPKVQYFDEVLTSESTYTTTLIAKELGMSAMELNRRLSNLNIQYKQHGTWVLYSKYQDKGYTKTSTFTYTDTAGQTSTRMQTEWTERGRMFVHDLIKEKQTG